MKKKLVWLIFIIIFLVISIIPNIPIPLPLPDVITYYFIQVFRAVIIVLPFVFLAGIIISAFIIVFFKKYKKTGLKLLLSMFLLVVLCLIHSYIIAPKMRDYSKGYVIKRAEPVIKAIEAYKDAYGQYPRDLYRLVPGFIDYIPASKVITIKKFTYSKTEEAYNLYFTQQINGWNYDVIYYNPLGQYEEGNNLRRYGKWRYYTVD